MSTEEISEKWGGTFQSTLPLTAIYPFTRRASRAPEGWHRGTGSGQSGSELREKRSPSGLDLGLRPGTTRGWHTRICLLCLSACHMCSSSRGEDGGWVENTLRGLSSHSLSPSILLLFLFSSCRATTCLQGERQGRRKKRNET